MELDIFFLREKVLSKSLIVKHIPAFDQYADLLTKPLSPLKFLQLGDKLKVQDKSSLIQWWPWAWGEYIRVIVT